MKTTEFKDSELGPIPKEWEVKRVGDIGDVVTGSTPPREDAANWNGEFPWISAKDFSGKYITNTVEHITAKGKEFCRIVPQNSVLVTCIASIGLNAIVKTSCATNQQINAVVCQKGDCEYFYYAMEYANKRFHALAGQTAVPIINKAQFQDFQIPFPPLAEQRRIAEVLGKTDEYIEALKKLIEKRKNVKRGAMQELLTGKCRLPGFEGEWVEKRLGEIGNFVGGGTPSTSVDIYWGGDIDWYTPAEIGDLKYVSCSERKITREGLVNSSARLLPVGTILLTTRASIGLRAILQREAATNQGFQSLVVNEKSDSEFMYYFLSTVVDEMESRASGSTFLEISSSKLKEIPIILPPTLFEQKAIAKVLSEMDEGIEALEKKLKKVEAIKEGMMQDLLTGKVRLKEDWT